MPRLFIAIDLPEQQRQDLEAIYCGLPAETRWTSTSQLHLTLRFIGEVDEQRFMQIKDTLDDIHFNPFWLLIKGLGYFPPRRKPNILWVGVAENPDLMQLQSGIEKHLVQRGISPETRKFHPHLTIARLTPILPIKMLADYLDRNGRITSPPFLVDNFKLYSSLLTRNGAIHRIEKTFNAKGVLPQ